MRSIRTQKKRSLFVVAIAALVLAFATPAGAALQSVGPVSGPHGFPLYYADFNDLSLELCLDDGWCFFDPVDPNNPNHVELGVGGEVFWWMAEAAAPPLVNGGRALLVLALEGTFGGDEEVVNGQQISFGRVRVRVDVPVAGTYVVTHPFGTLTFENVTVADGINYTADIGAANFLDVENGFRGALQSSIGPFLTWIDYANRPDLQVEVLDANGQPTGEVIQYVGNLAADPEPVVGSPTGNNFFRVEGPGGIMTQTDLFSVMGRVYDGKEALPHEYPPPPPQVLKDVGPINRLALFNPESTAELVNDGTTDGYPLGYPIWYQDHHDLLLTICPGSDPMCISDPVDPNDPAQVALNTGGETFWWAGDASINSRSPLQDETFQGTLPPPLLDDRGRIDVEFDAALVLGLEGTFGGDESLIDGQQISFGRTRIRIDTTFAGTYRVIYPYGERTFTVPAGKRAINFTADIGISDPADPDAAFIGALFSEIGPYFLTWDTFPDDPALIRQQPGFDSFGEPVLRDVQYVGDPGIPHRVTGAQFLDEEGLPINYFRVVGTDPVNPSNDFDVRTYLFAVQGKVFDPDTFRVGTAPILFPIAVDDTAITVGTNPVIIDVLANDTYQGAAVPGGAAVAQVTNAANGNAVLNGNNTFTYTANAGFSGTDTFTYTVTVDGQTSNIATVTVTVQPAGFPAPIANNDSESTTGTTPVIINVLANDTYQGGAIPAGATVSLVSPPTNGNAVLNANNTFTYTAEARFSGTDTFTYRVTVNGQESNIATVTVTVNPAPEPQLGIQQFSTTNNVRLARNDSVAITLRVRNLGTVEGAAPATVVGVQNGVQVYSQTLDVTHPVRGGNTNFTFPTYTPTSTGDINWTVTLQGNTATATTRVR